MPFIGNQPAEKYSSFQKQDFTTSATTSYTLDHPVANGNEIALFINFVRQEPTAAYTASGTSLTLTSATSSSDDMYCVYLGKAVQTINPPNSSVGNSQLDVSAINSQTAETSIAGGDEVLIYDTSASALRKMTRTNFVSGIDNTPAFMAELSSGQTLSNQTTTDMIFNSEIVDTDNAYNTSTGVFTAPEAGKYFFFCSLRRGGFTATRFYYEMRFDGSPNNLVVENGSDNHLHGTLSGSIIVNMAANDTAKVQAYHNRGSNGDISSDVSCFGGFKLIGV